MYWKAWEGSPPPHPMSPCAHEQSMRFSSDRSTSRPVRSACWPAPMYVHPPKHVTYEYVQIYESHMLSRKMFGGGVELLTFDGASGREGPAGAAVELVLDAGHDALLPPVDLRRESRSSFEQVRCAWR